MLLRNLSVMLMLLFTTQAMSAIAGVVDIPSSDDAQVVEGSSYSSTNYGSKTNMYIQSASGGYYLDERAWVKFDLEGRIPEGAQITSVSLRLYCWKSDSADDMLTGVYGSDDDSWDEETITWDGQPEFDDTALEEITMTANTSYKWYEWDVTNFVADQYEEGDTVASFVVKAVTESQSTYRTYAVDAKEYSAALAPRLRIEYEGGQWSTEGAFTIFHMNDVHSRILPHELDVPEPDDYPVMEMVGGASYFSAKMLELKENDLLDSSEDTLILDAGDISEGNPLGDLRGNGGMVDVYNLLHEKLMDLGGRGIDAVVVGNHDVRAQAMLDNLLAADFPVISCNVCYIDEDSDGHESGETLFSEYVTVTLNGTKVGILGYTNDESSYVGDDVDNVEVKTCVWEDDDSDTIDIKDWVETLRDSEGEACDVVILLAHMGHSRLSCGSDAVVADTGDVDPPEVVVAGHWHTWDELVWQPAQLNGKTIFTEAASYMQYIGELTVSGEGKYMDAGKHVIRNSEIAPNADMEALIATLTDEYNDSSPAYGLDDVIGYSAVDLSMDKDKWWTVSEYPWNATNAAGAWVCDAMVWKAAQLGSTVDLAMQSGGSIRRDVAKGAITYQEIYECYPWSDNDTVAVTLTGQEIWDALEDEYCGASLSDGWEVYANDGVISAIYYGGDPIDEDTSYTVAMSSYMAEHEDWASSKTSSSLGYAIRDAVVEYTAQYDEGSPMYDGGISTRYYLDTELAGGFRAVVTMVADSESQPYYEAAFIRLIEATDETLQRRNSYGLSDLVNSDGSINTDHQFSETMLYRSHLGFRDGWLQPGDIIEVWGEGGSYSGNPQFVDQHGIWEAEMEMKISGHDETLSEPQTQAAISDFWDEAHENHYVRFYAEKTGSSQVTDASGTAITVYQPGGYYTATLPGDTGDILEVTGVNTMRFEDRRFRLHAATVVEGGYPPYSSVDAVETYEQSGSSLTLTATAGDYDEDGAASTPTQVTFYYRYAEDSLTWSGSWTAIGTDSTSADDWSVVFTFPENYGYYEFYSVAEDADGNTEAAPVIADADVRFLDGSNDAPDATNPSITATGDDIEDNVTLTVTVSDADGDVVNVEFYDAATGELIGMVTGVATGQTASVQWTGLSDATLYEWYVVVEDSDSTVQSKTFSFSTTGYEAEEEEGTIAVPATGVMGILLLVAGMLFVGFLAIRKSSGAEGQG